MFQRLRSETDLLTSVTEVPSDIQRRRYHEADQQHTHSQQQSEFVYQSRPTQEIVNTATIGSASRIKCARLALTRRYRLSPLTHLGTETLDNVIESRALAEGSYETRTKQLCVHPDVLQAITVQLDNIHTTASLTPVEARWLRGDQLQASLKSAIEDNPLHQPSIQNQPLIHKHRYFHANSLGWLHATRLCIALILTSSSSTIHQTNMSRERRAASIQRAMQDPNTCKWESLRVMDSRQDVSLLLNLPPIYLGSPVLDGSLKATSISEEQSPGLDSTVDMLYLQLMLRCDPFLVHCTGHCHIIGTLLACFVCAYPL